MGGKDLAGKTALVTGASSGIGLAFATLLARRGAALVLTARREAELEKLAAELREKHGVRVDVMALDLSTTTAAEELFRRTEGAGTAIDVLINNAGFGTHAWFVEMPLAKIHQQMQLNIMTLTELCHRFAQVMVKRGRGHILNVSSIGAYTPCPTFATYSAGKTYVRDFSEAIAYELAPKGVRVCCLCPGGTISEFQSTAGQEMPAIIRSLFFMSAERCAGIGLSALFGWRRNVISGWSNKLGMFLLRFLPRRTIVWAGALSMGTPKPTT